MLIRSIYLFCFGFPLHARHGPSDRAEHSETKFNLLSRVRSRRHGVFQEWELVQGDTHLESRKGQENCLLHK